MIKQKGFTLIKIVISTPLQFSASDKGGFFCECSQEQHQRSRYRDYNEHKVTRKFHSKPCHKNHRDESKLTCNLLRSGFLGAPGWRPKTNVFN